MQILKKKSSLNKTVLHGKTDCKKKESPVEIINK